jgi:hypothetical protein
VDQDKRRKLKALLGELESDERPLYLTLGSMAVSDPHQQDMKVRLAKLRKWIATLKDVLGESG